MKKTFSQPVHSIDLDNIEPFTLIILQEQNLAEFRWDGTQKHFEILDASLPYIWSSATLYDAKAQEKRKTIFQKFSRKRKQFPKKAFGIFITKKRMI